MKIVADSNILAVRSSFENLAELRLLPGREITRSDLLNADALLVRSITTVDRDLLQGTPVRFVGTATSGTDHIDLDYLRANKIQLAHARGSNANAVVDYCFAALAFCSLQRGLKLEKCRVGLIGAGHVGGLFARKLEQLGIRYMISDPPLQKVLQTYAGNSRVGDSAVALHKFGALEEVLASDIVSLHVPLVSGGEHATHKLISTRQLSLIRPGAVLINTCRGSVVNEAALLERLQSKERMTCVIDVWENEPASNAKLVALADLATPHIAGYSQDAKAVATRLLLASLISHFNLPAQESVEPTNKADPASLPAQDRPDQHWRMLLRMLPLQKLSEEFKESARHGNTEIQFDAMRKRLLKRTEFGSYQIQGAGLTTEQKNFLSTLGVKLA